MSFADRIGSGLLDVRVRAVESLLFKLQHRLVRPSELAHDSSLFTAVVAHVRSLLPSSSPAPEDASKHLSSALKTLTLLGENQPLGSLRIVQSGIVEDLHAALPFLPSEGPEAVLTAHLLQSTTDTAARGVTAVPSVPCYGVEQPPLPQPIVGLGLNRPQGTTALLFPSPSGATFQSAPAAPGTQLIAQERKNASNAQLARIFKFNDPSKAWQQERLSEEIPVDEGGYSLRRVPLGAADDDLLVDLTLRVQYSHDVQGAAEVLGAVLDRAIGPSLLPAEALLQHPTLLRSILRLLDVSDRSPALTNLVLQCSEGFTAAVVAAAQTTPQARPDHFPGPATASSSAAPVPAALLYPNAAISSAPSDFAPPDQVLCATSALHVVLQALLPLASSPDQAPRVLALAQLALPFLSGPGGKPTKHQGQRALQLLSTLQGAWTAARALHPSSCCSAAVRKGEGDRSWNRHMLLFAEMAISFLELLPPGPLPSPLPPLVLAELSDLLQQDLVLRCAAPELHLAPRLQSLAALHLPQAHQRERDLGALEGQAGALDAALEEIRQALSLGKELGPLLPAALDSLPALGLSPAPEAVRLIAEASLQAVLEGGQAAQLGSSTLLRLLASPSPWMRRAALRQISEGIAAECWRAAEGSRSTLSPGTILGLLEAPNALFESMIALGLFPEAEKGEAAPSCPELTAQILLDLTSAAASRLLESSLNPTALFRRLRRLLPLLKGAAGLHASSSLGAVCELVLAHTGASHEELRDRLFQLFHLSPLERREAVNTLAATLPCQDLSPVASDPFEGFLDGESALERLVLLPGQGAARGLETFTVQDVRNLSQIVLGRDLPSSVRRPAADQLAVLMGSPRLTSALLSETPQLLTFALQEARDRCSSDLPLAASLLDVVLAVLLSHPGDLAGRLDPTEHILITVGCLSLCQSSGIRIRAGCILFRLLTASVFATFPPALSELLASPSKKGAVVLPPYVTSVFGCPLPFECSGFPREGPSVQASPEVRDRVRVRQVLAAPHFSLDRLAAELEEDPSLNGRLPAPLGHSLRKTLRACHYAPLVEEGLKELETARDHGAYRTGLLKLTGLVTAAPPSQVLAVLASPWPAALERLLFNCPANRDDLFLWIAALDFVRTLLDRAGRAVCDAGGEAEAFLLQKTLRFLCLAYQRSVVTFLARHATSSPSGSSIPAFGKEGDSASSSSSLVTSKLKGGPASTFPRSPRVVQAGATPAASTGWGPLEPERNSPLCVAVSVQLLHLLQTHCIVLIATTDRSGAQELFHSLAAPLLPYLTKVVEGSRDAPELLPSLDLASSLGQLAALAFPEGGLPSKVESGLAGLARQTIRQVLVKAAAPAAATTTEQEEEEEVSRFPGFSSKGALRLGLAAVREIVLALPAPSLCSLILDVQATAWLARCCRDREGPVVSAALTILTQILTKGSPEVFDYLRAAWPDLQSFLSRLCARETADRASLSAALQTLAVCAAHFEGQPGAGVQSGLGLPSLCLRSDLLGHVASAVAPRALVHQDAALQSSSLGLLSLAASLDVAAVLSVLTPFLAPPHRPWDVLVSAAALAAQGLQSSALQRVHTQLSVITHFSTLTSLVSSAASGDDGLLASAAQSLLQDPFLIPVLYSAAAAAADIYLDPESLHPDAPTARRIHEASHLALASALSALSQLQSSDPAQDLAHHRGTALYALQVASDVRAELRLPPQPLPSSAQWGEGGPDGVPSFVTALRKLVGNARIATDVQIGALSVLSSVSASAVGLEQFAKEDPALPLVVKDLTAQYLRTSTAPPSTPSLDDLRFGSVICLRNLLQASPRAREAFVDTCLTDLLAECLDAFALHVLALADPKPPSPPKQAELRREKLAHLARKLRAQEGEDKENARPATGGKLASASHAAGARKSEPPPHLERACTALSVLLACSLDGRHPTLREEIAASGTVRLLELLFTWALESERLLHWTLALARALLPLNPAAVHAASCPAALSVKGRPLETRGRLLELVARIGASPAQPPSVRATAFEVLTLTASSLPGAQALLRLPLVQDLPNALRPVGVRKDPQRVQWSADLLLALAAHEEVAPALLAKSFVGLLDVLVDALEGTEARPGEPVCPPSAHPALFATLCLLAQARESKPFYAANIRALQAIARRISVDVAEEDASLAVCCIGHLLRGSGGEKVRALLRSLSDGAFNFGPLRQKWASASYLYDTESSSIDRLLPALSGIIDSLEA